MTLSQTTANAESLFGKILDNAISSSASEGRNNAGFWLACQLRDDGFTQAEAESAAETYACRVGDGVVEWIEPREAAVELLASATPARNLSPEERAEHVRWALELLEREDDWQRPLVEERVTMVMDAHERLRQQAGGGRLNVEPHEPPDVLGCFVLVPAPASD